MHIHQHQSRDDRDVADAVGKETPAFAQPCDQHACNRRTDHARPIEHRRVQRDRIHQIVFATMSTRNDCRPGISNAFTTPSSAASTKTCHTLT